MAKVAMATSVRRESIYNWAGRGRAQEAEEAFYDAGEPSWFRK